MNIYVGNLSFQATEDDITTLFEEYGEVASVKLISDRETGRPRGFAFVEMSNDDEGKLALQGLNNKEFMERKLVVDEARPKENSHGGGGNRRGGSGGGRRDFNRGGFNKRR